MAISMVCIGKNMRDARKRAGFTQNEMAQKLGISETHYSNLERARRTLSLNFLVKFCAVLNIPFERLLSGAVRVLSRVMRKLNSVTYEVG